MTSIRAIAICVSIFTTVSKAGEVKVANVVEFDVAPSSTNVFSSPLASHAGMLFTVNVEPALGPVTGTNLQTVVRKGMPQKLGIWEWESKVIEPNTLEDRYHTQASIGVDNHGYIHVAYNMHNMPWQYSVSAKPGAIGNFIFKGDPITDADRYLVRHKNKTPFISIGTAAIPGNQITYPAFFNDRSGQLYVTYRFATRPKRRFSARDFAGGIAKYNESVHQWEPIGGQLVRTDKDASYPGGEDSGTVVPFAFTDDWSVYLIRLAFDKDDGMHVFWKWREGGAGRDTTHPSYAFSPDKGKAFYNSKGEVYDLPISVEEAELVVVGGEENKYFADVSLATGEDGRTCVVLHEMTKSRTIVCRKKDMSPWSIPENMPYSASEILIDAQGNRWVFATGLRILKKSPQEKQWQLIYTDEDPRKFGYPRAIAVDGQKKIFIHTQSADDAVVKIYMLEY